MKYIELFETIIKRDEPDLVKCEVGDYVKLYDMSFTDGVDFVEIPDRGKVVNVYPYGNVEIELIDNERIVYNKYTVERKLTPEEIEEFEFERTTRNYNL